MTKARAKLSRVRAPATARVGLGLDVALLARLPTRGRSPASLLANGGHGR